MEMSTEENERLVSVSYERSMNALHLNKKISESEMLVHEIESLSQEVNSGASFEQYFRWKEKKEVDNILGYIEKINLPEVSLIVQEAIKIAFPNGVPTNEDEYEKCTDWSEEQEDELAELFTKFEDHNGAIMNRLGQFIKDKAID